MDENKEVTGLDAAIRTLTDLSNKASEPAIINVSTDGLAKGLAASVPLAFDRNLQRFGSATRQAQRSAR